MLTSARIVAWPKLAVMQKPERFDVVFGMTVSPFTPSRQATEGETAGRFRLAMFA